MLLIGASGTLDLTCLATDDAVALRSGRRLADVTFVLVALCLLAFVAGDRFGWFVRASGAQEDGVTKGTRLEAFANTQEEVTLAIYLSPSCRYCAESMPFYRELAERVGAGQGVRVRFPSAGDDEPFRGYLSSNGLNPDWSAPLPLIPGVTGTPTIVQVGPDGTVEASWIGRLSRQQEESVLALVR